MSTITNISASVLSVAGSSSISSSDNDCVNSIGSVATSLATTASIVGSSGLSINVKAAELEQTKSYVESLSLEDQAKLNQLLNEKEELFNQTENPVVKIKSINHDVNFK